LPGESVVNGEDCHRGDAKARHNSCHEVSEPLGLPFRRFLFHFCRHNSRTRFLFFFVGFDLDVPLAILRENANGEAIYFSGRSKPKDCAFMERFEGVEEKGLVWFRERNWRLEQIVGL